MVNSRYEFYFDRFANALGLTIDKAFIEIRLKNIEEVRDAKLLYCTRDDSPYFFAYIEPYKPLNNEQKKLFFKKLLSIYLKELGEYLLPECLVIVDSIPADIETTAVASTNIEDPCWRETLASQQLSQLRNFPRLHSLSLDKPRQAQHRASTMVFHQNLDLNKIDNLKCFCSHASVSSWACINALFALLMMRFSNTHQLVTGTRFTLINDTDAIASATQIQAWLPNQDDTFKNFILQSYENLGSSSIFRSAHIRASAQQTGQNSETDYCPEIQLHLEYVESNNSSYTPKIDATVHYDIQLVVYDNQENIQLFWRYDANLFNLSSINKMATSLLLLIDQLLEKNTLLRDIGLISSAEIHSLTVFRTFNEQQKKQTVSQLFERHVVSDPNKIAILDQNLEISYAELSERSNRLANRLVAIGFEAGIFVGVFMFRSPLLIVTILALMKLRAVYVPLDPGYPLARLQYMISESRLNTILTQNELEGAALHLGTKLISIDSPNFTKTLDKQPHLMRNESASSEDLAYIIYTSGSTGQPKGVAGTVRSIVNRLCWMDKQYPVNPNERFAVKMSISFVDHLTEVLQPLVGGATLVIVPDNCASSPLTLLQSIKKHQISRITLIPSMLEKLLKIAKYDDLLHLQLVMSSGEPLLDFIARKFHKFFLGKTKLINLYGSTETGADVTCYEVNYEKYRSILEYFEETSGNGFRDDQALDISTLDLHSQSVTSPYVALEDLTTHFKDSAIPDESQALTDYLIYIRKNVLPYMVNVSYEKFIGHMTSALPNYIPLFSQIISKYNQNVVKVETSKSVTLLERQVLAMMHRLFFELPESHYSTTIQNPGYMHGIITSGGSLANISAMYCARNKSLLNHGISKRELDLLGATQIAEKLGFNRSVILVSRLAHYSVKKAAALLGIGENNLILIDQDENLRVRSDVMEQKIQEFHHSGVFIVAIIGIAGATETGTIDPLDDLADLAEKHKLYFHVDAAWGGAFMFSELYKHKFKGIERADSITFCAHKQLYLAQGVSLCLFRDPKSVFAISTHADYQSEEGSFDLGQFTLEGSRPANSLLLHASLHLLGKSGYAWIVERSMEKTAYFRQLLQEVECFQLIGDSDLNIINYRYIPSHLKNRTGRQYTEEENKQISHATEMIQKMQFLSGKTFVSKTRIYYPGQSRGKITVFRVVLSNLRTHYDDLVDTLRDQISIANELFEDTRLKEDELLSIDRISSPRKYMPLCPIGKPIDGVAVYILNEYLQLVPKGVVGELYVGGLSLAKGYIHSQIDATKWVKNPFDRDGKTPIIFKTGDMGRFLEDGNIEFCGRLDYQVKLNGCRIELAEIENVLMQFNGVEKAVVVIKENVNHENYLVAYLLFDQEIPDRTVAISRIKSAISGKLPAHMIPTFFYAPDEIPLNLNGKVDLRSLC